MRLDYSTRGIFLFVSLLNALRCWYRRRTDHFYQKIPRQQLTSPLASGPPAAPPATHLHSRDVNGFDGNGIASSYAWATLRASTLYALTNQRDAISAEASAELLLALLSEISPDKTGDAAILQTYSPLRFRRSEFPETSRCRAQQ